MQPFFFFKVNAPKFVTHVENSRNERLPGKNESDAIGIRYEQGRKRCL